jgi:hemoglobin
MTTPQTLTSPQALATRQQLQRDAAEMGISRAYVSKLVDNFYAEVRRNEEIGPIFQETIGEDWDTHLGKMKQFWTSVALNSGEYSGKPVQAHQALSTRKTAPLRHEHFKIWLAIFQRVANETAPTPAAAAFFIDRALRIAQSLQMAIAFGMPDGIHGIDKSSLVDRSPPAKMNE